VAIELMGLTGSENEQLAYPIIKGFARLGIGTVKGYELIKEGQLRTFLIGRRRYISEAELHRFIQRQVQKSLGETSESREKKVQAAVDARARRRRPT
jgi:hypothetical protein